MYNRKERIEICASNSAQTKDHILSDDLIDFFVKKGFPIGITLVGTPEIHARVRVDAAGRETGGRVLDAKNGRKRKGTRVNKFLLPFRR